MLEKVVVGLLSVLVIATVPPGVQAQSREGRWGPRPYPIEVTTAVAICMGEASAAGSPFAAAGSVDGAYITAGQQPIVFVTRDDINPDQTPWFVKRQGESMALVILHAGQRTHLAVAGCYESLFPASP